MAQESTISVQLFSSGYCVAHEKIVNPAKGSGKCKFFAVWALIQIPQIGYVLFDTGYSDYFNQATNFFPEKLYRLATPVYISEKETAVTILQNKGIPKEAIRYIIISHFHADHIAGLNDFPNATFICSKEAYEEVKKLSGIQAIRKGIIHKLLPNNFEKRLVYLEAIADEILINEFGITEFKIFGLKTLKLIALPGHATGMLGFIFQNQQSHLLYATDASWHYDCYQQNILPNKIVKIFLSSWSLFVQTQNQIKSYELNYKNLLVLFTHCPKTMNYINHVF